MPKRLTKPVLFKIEEINQNLTKDDKETLLNHNYIGNDIIGQDVTISNINQIKKKLKLKNQNEAYEYLRQLYNSEAKHFNIVFKRMYEKELNAFNEKEIKKNKKKFNQLISNIHITKNNNKTINISNSTRKEIRALGDTFQEVLINVNENSNENDLKNILLTEINSVFSNKPSNKSLWCNLICQFQKKKLSHNDEWIHETFTYQGKMAENIRNKKYINDFVNDFVSELIQFIESNDGEKGSGWIFEFFLNLRIQYNYRNISKVGSYLELPIDIKNKKCCVNIKNDDDKCLYYCLMAFKHYDEVGKKENKYLPKGYAKWNDILEPKNIAYPINIEKDIPKFEKLNNMKINIFEYDEVNKQINVRYNTKELKDHIVDLLIIYKDDKQHFALIKNFEKFMRKPNDTNSIQYYCRHCLNAHYKTNEELEKHYIDCKNNDAVRTILPTEKNKYIHFKNHQNTFRQPFWITYDFESNLEKCDLKNGETFKYQKHIPNSYGIKFCCIHDKFDKPIIIRNNNNPDELMKHFIEDMENLTTYAYNLTKQNYNFNFKSGWTKEQQKYHNTCKNCKNCNLEFKDKVIKVVHHDHISGEYISTLCSSCNLKFQVKRFIPIIAHNSRNYDSHFIVPYLYKYGSNSNDISCIPINEEKYISFSKSIITDNYTDKKTNLNKPLTFEMRFIDSFSFLTTSIEKLVESLKIGNKDLRKVFKYTSNQFQDNEEFNLMISKGIYPYDYITNYNVLNEKSLPFINKFYSQLNDEFMNYKDYLKALKIWKKFKCKTILDYHNLYLTCDVLLLSDIWKNFVETSYNIYGLDPNYYFTAPSLSWDAWLKFCYEKYGKEFKLELLTDINMYLMFEKSIRGGLSQISKRYAKANNQDLPNYNPNELLSWILYLDANNLYGGAMSAHLPYQNFKWNNNKWNATDILALDNEGKKGYLFEVDLHYPKELHKLHNNYALCSENLQIENKMLNDFQIKDRKETDLSNATLGLKKLVCSFIDKKSYVLNYRYLKLALKLGLQLIEVHRVIEYDQLDFMKDYILKNTNERKKAKSEFEIDFYKLMNNSIYGKTMENVRKRINFTLISSEEQALNLRNRAKSYTIFNENLVGVHLLKRQVELNKPIYIGSNVLDESKCIMYDFHYNFMLKTFNRNDIDLLMTDTDSLVYFIRNKNPYEVMKNHKEYFDLSNYPKDHFLHDTTNKKVNAKFKDVYGVNYITEFVGLRSKLYAIRNVDDTETKKCKGCKKSVVNSDLSFEKYYNILMNNDLEYINQNGSISQNIIRSYNHQLYTEKVQKIALNPLDDKVYICNNKIDTLNIGYMYE